MTPEIMRPAGMGDTTTPTPNPMQSISAGYTQLEGIVKSIIEMATGTPWYVWAGIAFVLIVRERGERE